MNGRRAVVLGVLGTCAWLVAASARGDVVVECTSELRAGSASGVLDYDGQQAIVIAPGERLCLDAWPVGRERIRFAQPSTRTIRPVLVISLEVTSQRSVLRVDSPFGTALRFRAGIVQRGERGLRETAVLPADPVSTSVWNEALPGIVLYGFERDPPVVKSIVRVEERALHNAYFGVSLVTGAMWNSLDAINRELEERGFGAQSELQPLAGLAFEGAYDWLVGSWDILFGPTRAGERASPDVQQVLIALHAGARPYFTKRFALIAPSFGIGAGDLQVDADPDRPPLSIAGLDRLPSTQPVRRNLAWLIGTLGADFQIHLGDGMGLVLGVRGGYLFQLHAWEWVPKEPDEPELSGGPGVQTSGPYVRLSVGFALMPR